MRYNQIISEDELFEINMSPSNLTKLVKDIPGALVGLEFEMIVPDVSSSNDDFESEPNYDYDERARDFDSIEDFFVGDFNSRATVRQALRSMQSDFEDWVSDKIDQDWDSDGQDYLSQYIRDNVDPEEWLTGNEGEDEDEAFDEFVINEWQSRGQYYDAARSEYDDENRGNWDEREWLVDEDLDSMSAVSDAYDLTWPYWTEDDGDGDLDLSSVADSFESAVGRSVKYSAGYHNVGRTNQATEGFYILEPDGSLMADPGEAGLEFVSPPLPLDEMMSDVKKVMAWANTVGAYTSKSSKTGLHMNVSVPGFSNEKLDYVKLVLLLGDNHILEAFNRVSYTYAKSSFDILANSLKDKPNKAEQALAAMKGHFNLAASKALHGGYTDKYTSINVKDNRVEFRGPGGNYIEMFEANPTKLFAPMMRFVVALEAAVDPEKYRDEYQKKLYKFLSKAVKSKDMLELFTDYAAGKGFPQSAFKSFLKQRKSERDLLRPGEGVKVGGRRSNPDGSWILFTQHDTGDIVTPYKVEVLYRFNAVNGDDATVVKNQYAKEQGIDAYNVMVGSDPTKKYGQPGDYKQATEKGNWVVYRKSDGRQLKYRGDFLHYNDMSKEAATKEFKELFDTMHTTVAFSDIELRPERKFEIYNTSTGRTFEHEGKPIQFNAGGVEEAETKLPRILRDYNVSEREHHEYNVRSVLTPPAHTTTTTQQAEPEQARTASGEQQATAANGVPMWVIYRISNGEVVHRFADHASSHSRTALAWLRDNGFNDNPSTNFRVRAMSQSEYSRAQDPTAVQSTPPSQQFGNPSQQPNYEIVRNRTGEVVHRFHANGQDDAIAKSFDFVTNQGWVSDDYTTQAVEQQPQQRPQQRLGRHQWRLLAGGDLEVSRFFADDQGSANESARQWLQQQDEHWRIVNRPFSVVPVTGNN